MVEVLQNVVPKLIQVKGLTQGILAGKITATTSAQPIPASPLAYRKTIMIRNDSSQTAYIGSSTVTSGGSNGMLFKNGEVLSFDLDQTKLSLNETQLT